MQITVTICNPLLQQHTAIAHFLIDHGDMHAFSLIEEITCIMQLSIDIIHMSAAAKLAQLIMLVGKIV